MVHADDLVEELKTCARTADRDIRSVCYENLGKRALAETVVLESPVIATLDESPVVATPVVVIPVVESPVVESPVVESPDVEKLPAVVESPPPVKEVQVATITSSNEPVVNDDWRFKEQQTSLTITSCRQAYDNKWFFFFDNGQVWKQIDTSRRRFGDCNFTAILIKDGLGHKLQIEGDKRKFRITRKR